MSGTEKWRDGMLESMSNHQKYWTKERLIDEMNLLIEQEEQLNYKHMKRTRRKLMEHIREQFGSYAAIFEYLPVDYETIKKGRTNPDRDFQWNEQTICQTILDLIEEGEMVNPTYIERKLPHLYRKAISIFGSYSAIFDILGLNYGDYIVSDNKRSKMGNFFEEIFAEVVEDMSREWISKDLRPDFHKGSFWIDTKLTETTDIAETRDKYEPHCDGLHIVYLMGEPNQFKKIGEKTWLVSVDYYLDKLPEIQKQTIIKKLDQIKKALE
jgi:hypothetical protein